MDPLVYSTGLTSEEDITMKKVIFITLMMVASVIQAASYIKIAGIEGESVAKQKAKAGYAALAKRSKPIEVATGRESSLPNGIYMRSDGKLLRVDDKHKEWIELDSATQSSRPKGKATGMPSGKRQHKPLSVTKQIDKASPLVQVPAADCPKGTIVRGKYKGRKCEHRGHVTVLK